jgi:hypothetical protein
VSTHLSRLLVSEELQPHTKVIIGGANGELTYKREALPQMHRSRSSSPLPTEKKLTNNHGPTVEELDSEDEMDIDDLDDRTSRGKY